MRVRRFDAKLKVAPSKRKRLKNGGPRTTVIIFPKLIEKRFEDKVGNLFVGFIQLYKESVLPALADLEREYTAAMRVDDAVIRMDSFTSKLNNVFGGVLATIGERVVGFKKGMTSIADDTNKWNRDQQNRIIKESVGVNILSNDKDMDAAIDLWVRENVRSIASLASNETKRVEQIIIDGFRNGLRHEAVAKGILDTFRESADRLTNAAKGMSVENKARMLARDQLGKLNAQITRARQSRLGINRYTWRTSRDERVRQTHAALEGQVFYWNAADGDVPDVGHPGVDYNCRCWAEPMLEDLFIIDS